MFAITVSVLALLGIAACATAKRVDTSTAATPPIPAETSEAAGETLPDAGFTGTWYVSGVFPTASTAASVADPHLGSALTIGAGEVSDVNGQRCITPTFERDRVEGAAIGLKAAVAGPWDRLVVTCDGKVFASYLRLPDRPGEGPALMQQRQEGLYLLEPAATVLYRQPNEPAETAMAVAKFAPEHEMPAHEAPMTEAPASKDAHAGAPVELMPAKAEAAKVEPALAPVTEGPVADAQVETAAKVAATGGAQVPAPGTAMHLASYKGQSAAKRGWKILLGEYDELDPLSPLYVSVDVPGKGSVIRLYATGATPAEISHICAALRAKKAYCALNP
jgi:hypothetical protein